MTPRNGGIMRLVVERGEDTPAAQSRELADRLLYQVKKQLLVTPVVELVEYGSLPRTVRKSQRVFDTRIEDSIV